MFISDRYELIFLEVPRTGSRSISRALIELDPDSPTARARARTGQLIDYHDLRIPEHADDYRVVAAHRDPYQRLWSHWKYRHRWGSPEVFKSTPWRRYVRWACDPGAAPEIQGAMLELPICELVDCARVTHWLAYEQLADSWRQLAEQTGLPLPALDWVNRSDDLGGQLYDEPLAAMVAERFAADFERFGYRVDAWRTAVRR